MINFTSCRRTRTGFGQIMNSTLKATFLESRKISLVASTLLERKGRQPYLRSVSNLFHNYDEDVLLEETNELLRICRSDEKDRAHLERSTFDRLMKGWSEVAAKDGPIAVQKSLELLRILERNLEKQTADKDASPLIPDSISYNMLLHTYASCEGGIEASQNALTYLEGMIVRCREYHKTKQLDFSKLQSLAPTTKTFNIVLNSWAKTKDENAGRKAEKIYTLMEDWIQECREMSLAEAIPNSRTLCAVMDAWAESKAFDATERVMAILEVAVTKKMLSLEDGHKSDSIIVNPNVLMFNSCIKAWALSGKGRYAAQKAETLLRWMMELNESGELGSKSESDEDDAGLSPTTISFSLVIKAWAESEKKDRLGLGAIRAQKILEEMITRYKAGENVKPNTVAFTTCIRAWAMSWNHENNIQEAQALFDEMAALYRETRDEEMKPSATTANVLISAWSKCNKEESLEKAEEILESMKEFCRPDLYSFNTVMAAQIRRGDSLKAYTLFQKMEKDDTLKPDLVSYNTALDALAKLRDASEAHTLLERMRKDSDVKPDKISYSTVINAWARRKADKRSPQKAAELLKSMLAEYREGNKDMEPDNFAFTNAIDAMNASDKNGRRAALKFAISSLEEMKRSKDLEDPNFMTYVAVLRICSKLSSGPAERIRLLDGVFRQCCAAGMAGKFAIDVFRRNVPIDVQKKYSVHSSHVEVPESWYANVNARDRPINLK